MGLLDAISPTPRNRILGLLADATQGVNDFASKPFGYDNPPARMLMGLLGVPSIATTLDRLSYGEPLTNIGKANVPLLKPETADAAMAAAAALPAVSRGALKASDAAVRAITRNPQATATKVMDYAAQINPMNPMVVYHGSPHKFDKFDSSKIGTGEGAQAYGHGLYLAESPDVAKSYQTALSADRGFSFGGRDGLTREEVQDLVNAKYGGGYLDGVIRPSGVADSFIDDMVTGTLRPDGTMPRQYKPGSDRARVYNELRGQITHTDHGSLYKVDLPDSAIAKMLDWDKPLSQQHPDVQAALKSMVNDVTTGGFDLSRGNRKIEKAFFPTTREQVLGEIVQEYPHLKIVDGGLVDKSGHRVPDDAVTEWMQNKHGIGYQDAGQLYRDLTHIVGSDAQISATLRNNGIPGIRYLDGGSRGAGAGTSNFVIFPGEESLLSILERNGVPLK